MITLIKKSGGKKRQVDKTHYVINFLTKRLSKNVSLAVINAKNHVATTKSVKSDRIYYVLNGKLRVIYKNNLWTALPGDVIFIPMKTLYSSSGTFVAIAINSPAFDIKYERGK